MASVYEIVTEQIVEQLENGVAPWRKPWRTEFPKNLRTLKDYRGLNVLLLASQGYVSPYWLTFNQAKVLGGPRQARRTFQHCDFLEAFTIHAAHRRDWQRRNPRRFRAALLQGFQSVPDRGNR